jgi:hypothetical protein
MTLHIIKLSVGADSIQDLIDWHQWQTRQRRALRLDPRPVCDTRNTPKQAEAIIGQGSLYWVIKGQVLVRQPVLDVVTLSDGAGQSRCEIVLASDYVRVVPRRQKPFQGWRYLKPADAPPDLSGDAPADGDLPEDLALQLRDLGVL